jgi:putative DNA primase/helicase
MTKIEPELQADLDEMMGESSRAALNGGSAETNHEQEERKADDDAWPNPISLDVPLLPPVPDDTFPPAIGNMIDATAAETETPRALAVGMALGTLAAACQGKIVVSIKPGYIEPLNLWPIAPLQSGERKTAVQQRMTRPLVQWECEQAGQMKAEIARGLSERETALAQIQTMRTPGGAA